VSLTADDYDRFVDIFTNDLVVDVSDLGLKQLSVDDPEHSLEAYIAELKCSDFSGHLFLSDTFHVSLWPALDYI